MNKTNNKLTKGKQMKWYEKKLNDEKQIIKLVDTLNQLSNENINAYDLDNSTHNVGSYFYNYPHFGQPAIARIIKKNGCSNNILEAKTTEELLQRLKDFVNGFEASVLVEFNNKSIFNK